MVLTPAIGTHAPPDVRYRSSIVLFREDIFFVSELRSVKGKIFTHGESEKVPVYKMADTLPGLPHEIHGGVRFRLEHVKTIDCCVDNSAYRYKFNAKIRRLIFSCF